MLISDGAKIDYDHIFGLDDIGMNDDYVPEGYFAITSTELTTDRLAFSENDGQLCEFFDLRATRAEFKAHVFGLLTTCEEEIIERKKSKEKAARTPEEIKRDRENYNDFMLRVKKAIEADRKKK